jgi:hypothetical protein
MIHQDFLASVSLDQLRMMQKVFTRARSEFGYPPRSWRAATLTKDLIGEFKAGAVNEDRLLDKIRLKHRPGRSAKGS